MMLLQPSIYAILSCLGVQTRAPLPLEMKKLGMVYYYKTENVLVPSFTCVIDGCTWVCFAGM
jgi:hypothetical protein